MDIQTIIAEADVRVPNVFSSAQKVDWLNEVNYEFFDIVKIPKTYRVLTDGTMDTFPIPSDLREKNVRKIVFGTSYYRSMLFEDIPAATNYYTVDETLHQLTLSPKPRKGSALVVYDQMGVTPFLSTALTVSPDAPSEYHWVYVLGLCVRIAKAMNDVTLANNYDADYKGNLMVAQQNYAKE